MSPSRVNDSNGDSAPVPSDKTAAQGSNGSRVFGGMNTSMVESKFLSHPGDLGVVAVGFSGGQVGCAAAWSLTALFCPPSTLPNQYRQTTGQARRRRGPGGAHRVGPADAAAR